MRFYTREKRCQERVAMVTSGGQFSIKGGISSVLNMMSDPYEGFDHVDAAYDTQNLQHDRSFQQAVARSSHGRRPMTNGVTAGQLRVPTAGGRPPSGMVPASSYGTMSRAGRLSTAAGIASAAQTSRPMTAVRAAGYSSYANKVMASETEKAPDPTTAEGLVPDCGWEKHFRAEHKCLEKERRVMDMLIEGVMSAERKNFKESLEKAKEAGRRERAVAKFREQNNLIDGMNIDLTFTVLFNLAQQYTNNEMSNEALNTYELIVKNKMFPNASRLKVNIGNIYFKKRDYNKAIKYYRMGLDQVPNIQKRTRLRIMNNIGVAFIMLGNYDEALSTFEHCSSEEQDLDSALNLVLTCYCLDDPEKMRDAFHRLLDVQLEEEEESRTHERDDVLMSQVLGSDALRQWQRQKRREAERAILMASKIISPAIASDYASGYEWCVEAIKQSVHASLATELEMTKAGDLLRSGDIDGAMEVLKVFRQQDTKIASAAANNLSMIALLKGGDALADAENYADQALSLDHYNANALVNAGNVAFQRGDLDKAYAQYREALSNDAACVQALYNMGLVCRKQEKVEQALDCFYKLNNILLNNVQVICQLAAIMEDTAQAIELYSQANSLAPSDPAILAHLAAIYDREGDKTQAFQCNYDSYRYFPSNLEVIEWMGAYYIDAQFSEKAVNYFEKASIMQPNEIRWQLMMASSHRRAGNYQRALDLYRQIHRRFPANVECLKFLVRLCRDLGMTEATEYEAKLEKAQKVQTLRQQRDADSSQGKRNTGSAQSLPLPTSSRPSSLTAQTGNIRMSSAQFAFEDKPFEISQRDMRSADLSYSDPIGPGTIRPKTGARRTQREDSFDDLDDALLPQ